MAYISIHSIQREGQYFNATSSVVRRCELGLLHTGPFLCQRAGQRPGINYRGRPCEKFQVKLASQASWCRSTLEVAFL